MHKSRLLRFLLLTVATPAVQSLPEEVGSEHTKLIQPGSIDRLTSAIEGFGQRAALPLQKSSGAIVASPIAGGGLIVVASEFAASLSIAGVAHPSLDSLADVDAEATSDPAFFEEQLQPIQRVLGTDEIRRTFALPNSVQLSGSSGIINTSSTFSRSEILEQSTEGLGQRVTSPITDSGLIVVASEFAASLSIAGVAHPSLESLAGVGAEAKSDPAFFEEQFQPIQRVPGADEIGRTFALPNSVQPRGNSGIINTSLTFSRSELLEPSHESTFSDLTLNLAPVFRTEAFGGLIFKSEARGSWADNTGAGGERDDEGFRLQRGATTLTRDFTESALRLTIGDVVSQPQNFQTAQRLLGVQLGTNYQAIHPYRVVFPSGRQTFQLDRPARVQIYADGVLVAQQLFQPGQFDVEQFATRYGTRNIELSVRDDTGGSTHIEFPAASGIPRLAEGLVNYGVSAGVISSYDIDGPEYLFDQFAASGFVDYGLTPNFTLGADFQLEPSIITAGVRSIYATDAGAVQVRTSVSLEEGESDFAVGLQYQSPPTDEFPTVSLDAKYYGENYPALSEYSSSGVGPIFAAAGDPKLELTASVSESLTDHWRVSAGGNWTQRYPDAPGVTSLYPEERWSAYISSQYEISPAFRASLSLSATNYRIGEDPSYAAMFTISHKFGRDHKAEVSYETRRQSSTLAVSSDPFESIDRTSWQLRAQSAQGPSSVVSLSGEFEHSANRFNAYGLAYEDRRDGALGTTRDTFLQVETAIGIADNTIAVGRPVRQRGFAIVKASVGPEGGDVYVDDWGPGEYRAKTSFLGPALVSDVLPYTNSKMELSLRTSHSEGDFAMDVESISSDILANPIVYALPYAGVVIDLGDVAAETKSIVAVTATPASPSVVDDTNQFAEVGDTSKDIDE